MPFSNRWPYYDLEPGDPKVFEDEHGHRLYVIGRTRLGPRGPFDLMVQVRDKDGNQVGMMVPLQVYLKFSSPRNWKVVE
jgi:hypothetical protein